MDEAKPLRCGNCRHTILAIDGEPVLEFCGKCHAAGLSPIVVCKRCSHVFTIRASEVQELPAPLVQKMRQASIGTALHAAIQHSQRKN